MALEGCGGRGAGLTGVLHLHVFVGGGAGVAEYGARYVDAATLSRATPAHTQK
jgi:hypothetical protein